MLTAASASSSSQVHREKYDVFISFRGSDTRHGFLSHLHKELCQNHIDVYVDDRLERGEEISPALLEAIEASMISLVIFSKGYASSKWCLEEIVKIMECNQTNQQIVIPIFYNIDPSDVRHQKGSYADAFAKHEEKWKDNMEKLQIWRYALTKIANLSGYHYSSDFQDESEFIDAIVGHILKKWADKYPRKSRDSKLLVGIYKNFSMFGSLMKITPEQVQFLGIWGTGGIGKTTLAQQIFDHFSSQFESSCFLENVRAKSKKVEGFKHLRQELFSELLHEKSLHVNAAIGRLKRKKVLIVLDDVDNPMQLNDLVVVEETCLGWGSRVIITSRDKHVLISAGIVEEYIHEVKELNFEESLKLFSLNAFKQNHPKIGYEELSKRTVAYAKGIPLALEVLGRHFSFRSNTYWESEFRKLQKYPNQDIQKVLKVSYVGLDPVDKQIFLDIAFFFVGEQKDKVTSVLEACDFEAKSGIENLVNKALVKISDERIIEMHDIIQEMGEQIVREESPDYPEKRSRLNDPKEIFYVLKNNMGTKKIQGITVDVAQIKEVCLRADTFTKMRRLRIIKFYASYGGIMESHIKLPHDLQSFPNDLRYFHWNAYPSKSLPLGFCPENLVELHLENNNIKKLWDGVQDLPNLETINLSGSQQLVELPDFSLTHKLKTVYLDYCENLGSVHPSILSESLVTLDLSYCSKLEGLESVTHLKSLFELRTHNCSSLRKFSLSLEKVERVDLLSSKIEILHLPIIGQFMELRDLSLNGSRLSSLPINEFCCFTNLERFRLEHYNQVIDKMKLETLFAAWPCLRVLLFKECRNLSEIPDNISTLTKLENLSLEGSSVEILPDCIQYLPNLRMLRLDNCRKLRSILGLPPTLDKFGATDCTSLEAISYLQLLQHQFTKLEEFYIRNCAKLDETSFVFIDKMIQGSIILAAKRDRYYSNCYTGSRVPNWIRYKQIMEVASNTVEFTCGTNELSLKGLVFCCVLSCNRMSMNICCNYTDGDNLILKSHCHNLSDPMGGYNSDHVFIWYHNFNQKDAGASYHGKIICEFSVTYENAENIDSQVPIKACGVNLVYALERKRQRDAHVDGTGYMRKQKKPREIQFL